MPTISISPKLTLHFLDPHPSGAPAVLLLHGLGVTGASWQLQFPPLIEAGFRPIAPDGRGFGGSSYPKDSRYPGGGHSVGAMAADLAALLDRLEVPQAQVIGISMGGTLAQQLALDHAQRVASLMLVNTFASLRPDSLKLWGMLLMRLVMVHTVGVEKQAAWVAGRLFPQPEEAPARAEFEAQVRQANPDGYRAAMRALARFNVTPRLGDIRTPTLVITGSADTTVPPRFQQVLVRGITGAQQIIVPGAGHAVIATHAEAFNLIMLEWLQGHPAVEFSDSVCKSFPA